jgi:hypothetical protein
MRIVAKAWIVFAVGSSSRVHSLQRAGRIPSAERVEAHLFWSAIHAPSFSP